MSKAIKRLAAMSRNPVGDWDIHDVMLACQAAGAQCNAPKRGSHYTVSHPQRADILTIPQKRPIKPVYIRLLVTYLEGLAGYTNDGQS